MLLSSQDVQDAAGRGPVYVMLLLGAAIIGAVVPVQITSQRLSTAEFIVINSLGAALIVAAGVLYLFLSQAALRALRDASAASTATAGKALDILGQAGAKIAASDGESQRRYIEAVEGITRGFGVGLTSALFLAPVTVPAGAAGS